MGTAAKTAVVSRPSLGPDNYEMSIVDGILTIRIDLQGSAMDSGGEVIRTGGGNVRVASSCGNTIRSGNVRGGFTFFRKEAADK